MSNLAAALFTAEELLRFEPIQFERLRAILCRPGITLEEIAAERAAITAQRIQDGEMNQNRAQPPPYVNQAYMGSAPSYVYQQYQDLKVASNNARAAAMRDIKARLNDGLEIPDGYRGYFTPREWQEIKRAEWESQRTTREWPNTTDSTYFDEQAVNPDTPAYYMNKDGRITPVTQPSYDYDSGPTSGPFKGPF